MKYSIIINNNTDNLYAVVLKAWDLDSEGNQINVRSEIKTGIRLQDALDLITNFIKING